MRTLIFGLLLLSALALVVSCGGTQQSLVASPPTPTVDQALAQKLTSELEKQLKEVSRTVTPMPLVWYVSETRTLYWAMKGDYNLDGTVSISDVTPLATYFLISWSFPTTEVVPWWVDGNGDRAVNIQDITPIAVHFGCVAPRWVSSVDSVRQVENKAMWAVDVPEGTDPSEVEITVSEPSVLTSVKIDPSIGVMRIDETDWLQFEATAYDQYGNSLEATWIWWVTNPELGTVQEGLFILDPNAAPGAYPDVVIAEAQQGERRVTGSASVVVLEAPPPENRPPEITSFSPSETSFEAEIGSTTEFSVEAEDLDGDEITFIWYLNEEVAGEGENYAFEATTEGIHEIKVVCSDGRGGNDSQSWTVTVPAPPPPPELHLRGIGAPLLEEGTTVVLQQGEGVTWEPFVVLDELGNLVGCADQVEWSSDVLPSWVFEDGGITTIIWRDPGTGEIEQLLESGIYDFQIQADFQGQEISLSAMLQVQENPDLP